MRLLRRQVNEVAEQIEETSAATQQLSEEISSSANGLSQMSEELYQLVGRFKV